MSSVYSFLVADTATGAVNLEQLAWEIERNAAIYSACEGGVVVDAAGLDIYFVSALSGGELSALTAAVAAHTPAAPAAEPLAFNDATALFDEQGRMLYDSNERILVVA